jgi:Flp pilus assembly protein TadG
MKRKCGRKGESGQALVFAGLSLVVLTGVVGLAIDMGYLRYTKRRLQTAADSAAIAGASELSGNYKAAALNDSKSNGFENGVNGVTVTSSNPPPLGSPFAGKTNAKSYVQVDVQQNAPTFFMRLFGIRSTSLTATAVAQLGGSRGCIYALGLLGGITVNGTVTAPGCGVLDNAILTIGGGCITARSIGVVLSLLGGCANPAPIIGIDPAADPLAYLNPPGGCGGGGGGGRRDVNSPTTTTLLPGFYCGGIRVMNTNRGDVVFTSGMYVLNGVGLQVQNGNTGNLSGNGVFFYVAGGGSVQIAGTGNVTMTAPANSPSPGIPGGVLFYQGRGDHQPASINGNLNLTGALYFPSATLTLDGNLTSTYSAIVAQTINFNGNAAIGTDYTSLPDGSPVKAAVLVQ